MKNREVLTAHAVAALSVIALLWLVPVVGLVAAGVALALIPPWGRGFMERAVISTIVVMGIVAIAVPRDSAVPVTSESARGLLTVLIIGAVALRIVPKLRAVPLPRFGFSDLVIIVAAVIGWIWLTSAYWGASSEQIISGLYFSGWDNQGHLLPFANTYMEQSTSWTTIDGTVAWNQWYPALHSTLWALAEKIVSGGGATRVDLLWPYVNWNAISFVASFAALAFVAGDLAGRLVGTYRAWARCLGAGAVAVFGLLGSPALLYNAGFTNFVMGIAVVASATYLSARTMQSARTLGWFLVPAAAFATLGLWSPLILGLVPTGVFVAVALWRAPDLSVVTRKVVSIGWVLLSTLTIGVLALDQSQAILGVDDASAAEFTEDIGAVGVGMIPFNTGMALAAPVVAILAAVAVRHRGVGMMVAVATPTLMTGVLASIFTTGADASGVPRLQSYYVLKALDGMLILMAPILAALVAAALVRALSPTSTLTKTAGTLIAAVVSLASFGYVGLYPSEPGTSLAAAPGVEAGNIRTSHVRDPLIGVAVMAGVEGANSAPEFTPLLWDGSGHLPNLWVRTLSGVLSSQEAKFYGGLPSFPYDSQAVDYLTLTLNLKPNLDVALVWFRPSSGVVISEAQRQWPSGRTISIQVPMTEPALCQGCVEQG